MSDETAQTPSTTPAPWTFTVPMTITAEDLEMVLVAAFEGGINGWASTRQIKGIEYRRPHFSEALAFDRTPLEIIDMEDDDTVHILDSDKLMAGLVLYVQNNGWPQDLGDIDAGQANEIIQYALFGDVIYG